MKNKLTVIKVLEHAGKVTTDDLDRWRRLFETNSVDVDKAVADGEISVETVPTRDKDDESHYITLVRIGNENYVPSVEELNMWRQIFEETKDDPDFKVFSHPHIEIQVVELGKVIAVE